MAVPVAGTSVGNGPSSLLTGPRDRRRRPGRRGRLAWELGPRVPCSPVLPDPTSCCQEVEEAWERASRGRFTSPPKAPARRAQPDPPVSGLAVTSTAKPPGSVPSLGKGCLLLEEQHCGPYAHPVSCDQRNLFQSPCDPPLTVQALRSYLPNGPQSVGNSMPSASNGPSFAGRGRVQAETDRFSVA